MHTMPVAFKQWHCHCLNIDNSAYVHYSYSIQRHFCPYYSMYTKERCFFPLPLPSFTPRLLTISPQFRYLFYMFSNCIWNDDKFQRFSLSIRLKKTDLYYSCSRFFQHLVHFGHVQILVHQLWDCITIVLIMKF